MPRTPRKSPIKSPKDLKKLYSPRRVGGAVTGSQGGGLCVAAAAGLGVGEDWGGGWRWRGGEVVAGGTGSPTFMCVG